MTLESPVELVRRAEEAGNPGVLAAAPGWNRVPLGNVAKIVNGAPFLSSYFNVEGHGMPLVRIRDVRRGRTETYFSGAWQDEFIVRPGSILVGMDGDFSVARWPGPEALLNQRVCRIDVDDRLYEPRFLLLCLQGYLDAIWQATSSVTVKHLSSRSLAEVPLPAPELSEQRRIVDILEDHLSRLDAGIGQSEVARHRASRLFESTLVGLLGVAENVKWVPLRSWVTEGLSNGKSVPTREGGFPVLRLTALQGEKILLGERKSGDWDEESAKPYLVRSGDVLVSRGNGSLRLVGRAGFVGEVPDPVAYPDTMIRIRLLPEIDRNYFVSVWNSRLVRNELEGAARTTAGIYKVNQKILEAQLVPMCPPEEQKRIAVRLEDVRLTSQRLLEAIQLAQARVTSLRRALLAAAFSGRLTGRSSDLDLAEELAAQ